MARELTALSKPREKTHEKPPDDSTDGAIAVAAILGGVVLVIAFFVWLGFHLERRKRGGVGVLKRRWLRKHGSPAEATVLSVQIVDEATSQRLYWLRSIIYDVRPLGGHPPFRAKGFERMYSHELAPNGLVEGRTVRVLFDPKDHAVTLARRVSEKDIEVAEEEAKRAREDALLRGKPGSGR